jgi:hypothetical protein
MWQRGVALLLWALVGVAKTIALVLLLTAADRFWPQALFSLGFAWGLVGLALLWRGRVARDGG